MSLFSYYLSFSLIFLFANSFFSLESKEPVIVFLRGTCSSGKSTLIKSLIEQRQDIEIIDEDAFTHEAYTRAVEEKFPVEYASILKAVDKDNMYHLLRTKEVIFKKTATDDECKQAKDATDAIQEKLNHSEVLSWKQEISQNISKQVLKKIQIAIQNKKNILLDAWYIKDEHLHKLFPETEIFHVMLYCSLKEAYERLLKRNKEAVLQENLREKRLVGQLVGSFCTLYEINPRPFQPIESVNKDNLSPVFQRMHEALPIDETPKSVFTFKELSRSELKALELKFMQPLEDSNSNCYISPKQAQHLIIDNTNINIKEAVRLLEEIFDNYYPRETLGCNL